MSRMRTVSSTLVISLVLVGLLLTPTLAASPAGSPERPLVINANDYFDSGWVVVAKGNCEVINHNLGGDPNDYAVELLFLDEANTGLGIHRRGYGGLDNAGSREGGHWQRLLSNTVELCRGLDANLVDRMRVRVFVPAASGNVADSGWQPIAAGATWTYPHNLGVPAAGLTVGLWFRDNTVGPNNIGIHHFGFGGLAINATHERHGAHWHNLTNNTVQVTRHPDDTRVGDVRLIVVEADAPDYDSLVALGDWQTITAGGSHTFAHNLNWDPNMLLVRGECLWPILPNPPPIDEWGIHKGLAGGNVATWLGGRKGSNMQRVQSNTVQVERWPDDNICPKVRVRIWKRSAVVYVPLVLYNDG